MSAPVPCQPAGARTPPRGPSGGASGLRVTSGQHSEAGRKPVNQDRHGLVVPPLPARAIKGIVAVIADGISSSNVSQVAAEIAVAGFLDDYYSTPDSWGVKQSGERVLRALNAWLHAHTRQSRFRYDLDRGYLCTFSALVLKSATAHLFHVGDTRIYRMAGGLPEPLTTDHRLPLSASTDGLSRALGMDPHLEIDYRQLSVAPGDVFLLASDGVYEHLRPRDIATILARYPEDLTAAARALVTAALSAGSPDNLTAQLVRIDALPEPRQHDELGEPWQARPFAPEWQPGQTVDGFHILRTLHASSRSRVYLAQDLASGTEVVLKCPATELREQPDALAAFQAEEWVARRIHSPHVARPFAVDRPRSYRYLALTYHPGRTLRQWLLDQPRPDLHRVRSLLEQIAAGLRAFHRLAMAHGDLRPDNILVDDHGTVTLIDFGATQVAGLQERAPDPGPHWPRGAALYSAPESFLGQPASAASDQFSLAVIAYQMLTGQLPYGAEIPKTRSLSQQRRLRPRPLAADRPDLPGWLEPALKRALAIEPHRRYPALSEFLFDLSRPRPDWQQRHRPPWMTRHPVAFWQGISALLLLALLATWAGRV